MTEWNLRSRSHACHQCAAAFADGERCFSCVAPFTAPVVQEIFAEKMSSLVCTGVGSTSWALAPDALAARAVDFFGADNVYVASDMAEAIDKAVALADAAGAGAGVLIAGSVIAAGEARALLVHDSSDADGADDAWLAEFEDQT